MGSFCSKIPSPPKESSSNGGGMSSNGSQINLISYESECLQDSDLQNFDSMIQQRTLGAVSSLVSSGDNSISFHVLRQVTGCLLDNNQEVVKMILEYKKDIWKNPELFDLVEEYFENSLRTLDFCTALEKCLRKARDSQIIINLALRHFEEEDLKDESYNENGNKEKKKYKATLDELQHFKNAGDPFTEEFFQVFQSVYKQQTLMLEKLKLKQKKLDKKFKSIKAYRRVSSVIFVSAIAAVVICSVAAALLAAPPVAAALAAVATVPLGSIGKWVDSLWKDYSVVLKEQNDLLSTMKIGTCVAVSDLDTIRVLVDKLETQISALLHNVDFVLGEEDAVKFGIDEIKKKLDEFMKGVEDLGIQVDRCSRDIQRARTVVLQRIIRPSDRD